MARREHWGNVGNGYPTGSSGARRPKSLGFRTHHSELSAILTGSKGCPIVLHSNVSKRPPLSGAGQASVGILRDSRGMPLDHPNG